MPLLCRSDCPVWLGGSTSSGSEVCMAQQKLEGALHSTFRHTSFPPGQLEALLSISHGKDVFVCMPTGGGKSLCMFLVPVSVGSGAIRIVISPLVGLIEQQVSTSIMHVVSVCILWLVVLRYLSLCLLECLLFMRFAQNTWPT